MERKISVLLLVVMLAGIIPCYAAPTTITSEYYVYQTTINDVLVYNLAISGTARENADIRMVAYKKGSPATLTDSHIKAIDQTETDASGNFSFLASLTEEGVYVFEISVNNMTTPHTFEFEIKGKSYYEDIISKFTGSLSISETEELINTYGTELLFNEKFFNSTTPANIKTDIASRLYNKKGSMTTENAVSLFDESVILSYMMLNDDYEKAEELLQTYEDSCIHLKDTAGAANIYKTCFVDYPRIKEAVIRSLMGKEYTSVPAIRTAFREAVIVKAAATLPINDLSLVVSNNCDYLNVSYTTLADTAKSTVLSHIIGNKQLILTKADFLKYYYEGIALLSAGTLPQAPAGGGGGGGGGGSSDVKVDPSLITVPQPEIYEAPQMFTDLDSVPWAYDSVKELYNAGIVNGKSNANFCPNDYVKREEFAKMLAGALGLTEEAYDLDFTDVSQSDWYYKPISLLKKYELVKGMDNGGFGVGKYITREDMATMIYRAITVLYIGDKLDNTESTKEFADFGDVSSYAQNSVIMLSNMEIIKGLGNNLFAPKKNATRAETAVIIKRVMDLNGRNAL